jgi:hypothetical protein
MVPPFVNEVQEFMPSILVEPAWLSAPILRSLRKRASDVSIEELKI